VKKKGSKEEAKAKIDAFFERDDFSPKDVKKVKRLAMAFNVKLGKHRKKFCGNCLSPLRGKTRVTKTKKNIICENCGFINRTKLI